MAESGIAEDPSSGESRSWLTRGVAGIGTASFLADVGHEVPTALLPSLVTSTLGGSAAALGVIEGVSDGLAGAARLAGGALADDPGRRRSVAVGGYTTTAALGALIGAATSVWQVALLRAGSWTARGLRVPARNALLADVVPSIRLRPGVRLRAGHGQPGSHLRTAAGYRPGRGRRRPVGHRPVRDPRPSCRGRDRLRHPACPHR